MTDNEIIKALECFAIDKDFDVSQCVGCAFESKSICCENASEGIAKASLDLINRQQAEIERLRYNLEDVLNERADHSEAIKEFAERLKTKKHECGCNYKKKPVYAVTEEKIDETYKEMVGDAE